MDNTNKHKINGHPALFVGDTVHLLLNLAQESGLITENQASVPFIRKLQLVAESFAKALRSAESSITFKAAAEFSLISRAHRRPSTVADLRSYIRRMSSDAQIADKCMREITIQECRLLLDRHFSHSAHSYRKAQSILHSIFSYAMRQQWCESNPAKAIIRPPVSEQRIEILTLKQIRALLKACSQHRKLREMEPPLRLMLWCGIRPAEVRRLKWADIDPIEKVVYVEARNSKTGGSRAVPLRGGALTILKDQQPPVQFIAPSNWNRRWKQLRNHAELTNWQNDALRHTFASMHLKRFHNLILLQEEMGHRNSALLQTRYLNLRFLHYSSAYHFFEQENWS